VTADELKAFPLCVELGEEDREALAELLEEQRLHAGRSVFREGTESDGLVLIAEGTVRLEGRRLRQTGSTGTGAALGALSLLVLGPREATAICETPCRILRLRRTAFRRLLDDHPRTACRLLEGIVAELGGMLRPELDRIAEA
jgi:CRP-like cAMP-binding protein